MAHRIQTGRIIPPVNPAIDRNDAINRGLVGAWMLNEGAGLICKDWSGWRNAGVITHNTQATTWVPGRSGKAVKFTFDGVAPQAVTMANATLAGSKAATLSFWVYQPTTAATEIWTSTNLAFNSGGWLIGVSGSSGLVYSPDGSPTSFTYPPNVWFHIVYRFTVSTFQIFVNGQPAMVSTGTGQVTLGSITQIVIGLYAAAANAQTTGSIQNFRAWNRALSPAEIIRLYARPLAGTLQPTAFRSTVSPASGLAVTRDAIVPAEWRSSPLRDSVHSIEWKSTGLVSYSISNDWKLSIGASSVLSQEALTFRQNDYLIPNDHTSVFSRDAQAPNEWQSSNIKDAVSPIEFNKSLNQSSVANLESLATDQVSILVPNEFSGNATVINDSAVPIEWRYTLLRDSISPTDFNKSVSQSSVSNYEALIVYQSNAIVPSEFSGSSSITIDAAIPIEWRLSVFSDKAVPAAWSFSLNSDSLISLNWNVGTLRDGLAPFDSLNISQLNGQIPIDFGGATGVIGDATIPLDWRSTEFFDQAVGSAWSSSPQVNSVFGYDSKSTGAYDRVEPIEWSVSYDQSINLNAEVLSSNQLNYIIPAEFLGVASIIRDGLIPIDFRSSYQTSAVIHNEFLGGAAVMRDTSIPIDILSSRQVNASIPFSISSGVFSNWGVPLEWSAVTHAILVSADVYIDHVLTNAAITICSLEWIVHASPADRKTKGSAIINLQHYLKSPALPPSTNSRSKGGAAGNVRYIKPPIV